MDYKKIEKKWVEAWDYSTDPDKRPKTMVTFPYPYMNGALHMGHAFTSTRVDVYARFKRMQQHNVLFPFAFHATGEPIVGMSKRVKMKEEKQLAYLKNIGIPEKDIQKFEDPLFVIDFYKKKTIELSKRLGLSVDWRRQFTTIDPKYNKFIEWQYLTLKKKGLVTKGTHPVIYCPTDESPTGDHDRLVGEGESIEEYTVLKFRLGKRGHEYLVAATLRPETVFGQTNMWVNPNLEYVKVKASDETWIMSRPSFEKLQHQLDDLTEKGTVKGSELVGKMCHAPGVNKDIMILPAHFVDASVGTGLVTSVPSHAVYDYQALVDLQNNREECEQHGLDFNDVRNIKLIALIDLPGWGEHPAKEFCEKNSITDQSNPKLEEGKKKIYKEEFHKGVMKQNCGKYSGMKVSEAKEQVKQDLIKSNDAFVIYEMTGPVQCRCTTWNFVKVLKDQWFLKYSDEKWKAQARKALKNCKIYPEDYRKAFENTIEWLKDKACARKSGMGTKVPWDKDWIVETLSDSTIYTAFYTISHKLDQFKAEELTLDFFDYVYLGKGKGNAAMKELREEFKYWYPVDFRNSGKDLVNNHLTFYLFHHCGIWPEEYWPAGIGVNGFVTSEGEKMSKSKGNVINLESVLDEFGADIVRMNLMYSAEGTNDPDWRTEGARSFGTWMRRLVEYVESIPKIKKNELQPIDHWMLSSINARIPSITQAFEKTFFRTALKEGFFDVMNDFRWYKLRTEGDDRPGKAFVEDYVMERVLKFVEPFCPFIAHELWEKLRPGEEFVGWPEVEKFEDFSEQEGLVRQVGEDVREILKILETTPKKIVLYTTSAWKWPAVLAVSDAKDGNTAMKTIMGNAEFKSKATPAFVKDAFNKKNFYAGKKKIDEFDALTSAINFFSKEFDCKVEVYSEDDEKKYDPGGKSKRAMPLKPAIFVE